ncbi:hypothetical protein Asppvi_004726 [Aspergillus pseudoviridinutans]|uniref:Uncharacterized protein n=1 Tax=Aspergillus pseudoviridinutans TaxID=1517512 RepID=A0A9P3B6Z5_9EURO|nr:uncharacterized protein Asppvi_004726 [Aspergillus pseudoviridinutans]GIJ85862.1 hypothetical protein Asppvi_004726 [Aspergillus pseudoviridinutans]
MAQPDPEEQEMASASATLHCTTCKLAQLPRPSLLTALATGLYNPRRDPPFLHPQTIEIDGVSPRTIPPEPQVPGYQRLMTPAQHESYSTALEELTEREAGRGEESGALFARYMLDFHIHVHYLSRRGMLTLCRDVEEVHEMRRWRWRVALVDDVLAGAEYPGKGCTRGGGKRGVRPPNENPHLSMYQMALWRRRWLARRQRVDEVRLKWAAIVEERRKQRAAAARTIKVRLHCSREGYKAFIREVEVEGGTFDQRDIT